MRNGKEKNISRAMVIPSKEVTGGGGGGGGNGVPPTNFYFPPTKFTFSPEPPSLVTLLCSFKSNAEGLSTVSRLTSMIMLE